MIRVFNILLLIFSFCGLGVSVYGLVSSGLNFQNIFLAGFSLFAGVCAGVGLWRVETPPPPHPDPLPNGEREIGPQDTILAIIGKLGKAKRKDLLPHVSISKSSLVRLLDKMEAEGLIVQVGE